jgi:hypothetical protein
MKGPVNNAIPKFINSGKIPKDTLSEKQVVLAVIPRVI